MTTATRKDVALMAHLLRRAGFGATPQELDRYLAQGYEATVEELLHPPQEPDRMPEDIIRRYHVDMSELRFLNSAGAYWLYRMVTTVAPLQEKIALFFHGLFATGYAKTNQARALLNQIDMFRRFGLGSFRDLLVELSKDPAMIIWLDNHDNHKGAINENYGRELLELFSMGIGNYTEDDIKEAARAFTGWTLANAEYMAVRATKDSIWPYGRIAWHFQYRADDHDYEEKTFLGQRGRFNGADVVDVIVRQPACARFICTRLYRFFAADQVTEAGQKAIEAMMEAFTSSGYQIRPALRALFLSDHFKHETRFARVKSPAELVVGVLRLAGDFRWPRLEILEVANRLSYMGQTLLNPPTVEGWHEGEEWIDSGALVERVNFAAQYLGDPSKPGIRDIIDRLARRDGGVLGPEALVEACLEMMGPLEVAPSTRQAIVQAAAAEGPVDLRRRSPEDEARVARVLALIGSTREFQMA